MRPQVVHSVTRLVAVVRRCRETVARRTWWLVDKFLRSRRASALAKITPTITVVAMVLYKDGAYGLVANAENLIAAAGVPSFAIRWARRKREIDQPRPPIAPPTEEGGSSPDPPPQPSEEPTSSDRRVAISAADRQVCMTRSELLAFPVAVNLPAAARALGISRSTAYKLARRHEFPCRVLRVGGSYRVPTADLLRVLGIAPSDQDQAPPVV